VTSSRRFFAVAMLCAGVATAACSRAKRAPPLATGSAVPPTPSAGEGAIPKTKDETAPLEVALPAIQGPVRFIAIGGGASPESTEISLEQDIELVASTLPGPGRILFAGGASSFSVREADEKPHGDELLVGLGDLFHPRAGRSSHYERVRLPAERSNLENVEQRLSSALSESEGPLLLYIAAHGDQGDKPRDNSVVVWGGRPFTVARLAEIDEAHTRPLRLVVTSCFSGGFGDLAFDHAEERRGPSKVQRCGVFAGTWDRETSGCDANPDRKAQESYGLHFIHALRKQDRSGAPLAEALVDYNHDGKIGLLDAHTRARIAAASLDVPTTTSERYLRSVEHGSAPVDRALLPEDAAVVDQLGATLSLRDEASVEKRWDELDRKMSHLDDELNDAQDELGTKEANLGSRLLERWPVIDDAFHPDFVTTLAKNHDAIADVLTHSAEAASRAATREKVEAAEDELAGLEVEEARLLRLRRAYETLHLAAALMRRGGPAARYYAALLACERQPP
jgi:hypothetical protein